MQLRKRPAAPAAPPPAKKKAVAKPKAGKKEAAPAPAAEAAVAPTEPIDEDPAEAPPAPAPTPATATATASAKPAGAAPSSPPKPGDTIALDDFGGEIETNEGAKTSLAALVRASEAGVVLFTYPKASTPGCTTQACLFRDAYAPLTRTGLAIYGLSADGAKANTTFRTKQRLPFALLCDPAAALIGPIGMKKSAKGSGVARGVFVVDKRGKVLAAEAGGPARTVDVVRDVVAKMGGSDEAAQEEEDKEEAED